ncbi:hypothetical protein C4D60_Mb03t09820 [Musa balbisiana]|uniref:AN1-type domain-containing protein n=1 Tax=Musa balbisiana TaxID=52838 RepID=A0A4S8J9V6_MUSBA|nr:hypothetical protein C4D60_Mb03t09820 [Musa balbisiana]
MFIRPNQSRVLEPKKRRQIYKYLEAKAQGRQRRTKKEAGVAMGGGTEAFPDLGEHCQHEDCNQLDFLPFTCHGCKKVFCLEHRSYAAHVCPKADHNSRFVVVCEACSMSMEKRPGEEEKAALERHEKSGSCNPSKKKKPRCPVKRCKEVLTFSNNSTCKVCNQSVCLKHRFPSDHACKPTLRLPTRSGMDCGDWKGNVSTRSSVKAC